MPNLDILDPRIVRVEISLDGQVIDISGLKISISGQKLASSICGKSTISITNMERSLSNRICREANMFKPHHKLNTINVFVGRESYGEHPFYSGLIFVANQGQPPDMTLTLQCVVGGQLIGNAFSLSGQSDLHSISQSIAEKNGLNLENTAPNKNIGSYHFAGTGLQSIQQYAKLAGPNTAVYQDGGNLVVHPKNQTRVGRHRTLTDSDIVGRTPLLTTHGVQVKFLYDPVTCVGGMLTINSQIFPEYSGSFNIFKLDYEITNRDQAFTYTAHGFWMN